MRKKQSEDEKKQTAFNFNNYKKEDSKEIKVELRSDQESSSILEEPSHRNNIPETKCPSFGDKSDVSRIDSFKSECLSESSPRNLGSIKGSDSKKEVEKNVK